MKKLSEYDWFCDECHEYLNDQSGFDAIVAIGHV